MAGPYEVKPGFHHARGRWNPGFIQAFRLMCRLRQLPLLVGAVLAGVDDQLGAVAGRGTRVVQAQRAAVGLQLQLAVGQLAPLLVSGAVAGPQDDLAADAAVALVVQALVVVDELVAGEPPALGLVRTTARPDHDRRPVGGAVELVVHALVVEADDRVYRTGDRRRRRPRRRAGRRSRRKAQRGGERTLGGVGRRQAHGRRHTALAISGLGGQRRDTFGQRGHAGGTTLRRWRSGVVICTGECVADRDVLVGAVSGVVGHAYRYRGRRGNVPRHRARKGGGRAVGSSNAVADHGVRVGDFHAGTDRAGGEQTTHCRIDDKTTDSPHHQLPLYKI